MNRLRVKTGILLLWIAAAVPAGADEIRLTDGSVLMGSLVSIADATAHFSTSFAGELALPLDQIAAIRTNEAVMVSLENGERLQGVLSVSEEGQRLAATSFGEIPLDLSALAAVWRLDAAAPEDAALIEAHEQELAALEAERAEQEKKMRDLWSGRFELGFKGESGNKDRMDFFGRAEARRRTDLELLTLYIQGKYAEVNHDRSSNEIKGGAQIEFNFTERWFAWGAGELEYDEFENLDLRAIVSGGLGHHFIKEEKHTLKGRLGAGYMHENFSDGTSENEAILEIGYDYMLHVNDWLRFTHFFTYYPELDDPLTDYRFTTGAAGEVPLSKEQAWKLRAGVNSDYDSSPRSGIDKLDTYYFMTFLYDWK